MTQICKVPALVFIFINKNNNILCALWLESNQLNKMYTLTGDKSYLMPLLSSDNILHSLDKYTSTLNKNINEYHLKPVTYILRKSYFKLSSKSNIILNAIMEHLQKKMKIIDLLNYFMSLNCH